MLDKLLRAGEGRRLKRFMRLAEYVVSLEDEYAALTDEELQAKTGEFRKRIEDGEGLDELLPEAFAVAREASHRVLGQKHYTVQVLGGIVLHTGAIAEMKTGEGKTLTCVLPAYLNALGGEGVHVVTVNDYLAKRDAEWMGRIHQFLGLEVGAILSGMPASERREVYAADVIYGTNNEFGFDYLRDNMAHKIDDLVQRGHNYAIVDEVDSILIDEARTPLIISGPADGSSKWYGEFARIAPMLEDETHYEVDRKKRTIGVTELGVEFVEDQLGIDNLYETANSPLVSYLNNSIKAKELFVRDKDYIVRDGDVIIVDEFTGRVLDGRRYNEGMHQALEAKERVEIKAENQTLATITLQNYFRLYDKLAGMTGTAETEAAELYSIYKLDVVPIPTNKPMVRLDEPDLIYKTEEAKFEQVVEDIAERVEKQQPVLVGTTSVERSEHLSRMLNKRGIKHHVLNAKYHASEAEIIAQAGRLRAVTVATNMAGRGTDIVLGGNPDIITDLHLRERGLDPLEEPETYQEAWDTEVERLRELTKEESEKVREVGGLYVLGTERHDSRRIDNQLRGRSGRQGDPGESRFYLSLGDELMRRFNGAAVEAIMNRFNLPDDVPISARMVTRAVKNAQGQVESQNYETRKNVLKYDEVMNQQRIVIYEERNRILRGEDITDQVESMIYQVIAAYVDGATSEGYVEDWDLDKLWDALKTLYPVSIVAEEIVEGDEYGAPGDLSAKNLRDAVLDDVFAQYDQREEEIESIGGEGAMRQLERSIMLQVLDRKWREHLYEMDYLKEGIGLRAMAQRDPVVEYQREGYDMFAGMMDGLREETVAFMFNVKVEPARQTQMAAPSAAQAATLATGATSMPSQGVQPADGELPRQVRADPVREDGSASSDEVAASGPGEPETNGQRAGVRAQGTGADLDDREFMYSGPDGEPAEGAPANRAQRRAAEKQAKTARRDRAARGAQRGGRRK